MRCEEWPYLILRVLNGIFADELQFNQLQKLIGIWNSVKYTAQIRKGLVMTYAHKRCECVALASMITLGLQECSYQLRGIRNQTFRVLENRGDCKYCVLANICVTMLEAGPR